MLRCKLRWATKAATAIPAVIDRVCELGYQQPMIVRILTLCVVLFACFYGLASYPLLDNNEGLYAAIARDMLQHGDVVIPHLNTLPYIEKPPMLYWLLGLSMAIFGVTDWAAHLVPALALCITACCMWRFLCRSANNDNAGLNAALIFTTSLPLLAMQRMIMCDMVMTCFLSAALMQFFTWYRNDQPNKHLLAFWALLAGAILSKGFATAILAFGTIGIFMLWERAPFAMMLRVASPAGIAIFLLLAAPWHIAATLKEPGFAWYYFINEHLMRFLGKREPHDYYTGPVWYYVPRIVGYLLPWTFFLLLLPQKRQNTSDTVTRFLWTWFGFAFVFFSLAGGKANYYMLAGMPPLVMLLGMYWERVATVNTRLPRSLVTGCLLTLVLILGFSKGFCVSSITSFYDACQGLTWDKITLRLAFIGAAILGTWKFPLRFLPLVLSAYILIFLPTLIKGVNIAGGRVAQDDVAEYLLTSGNQDIALYQDFEEVSSLAFYIPHPIYVVNSLSDDLLYGKQTHSESPYFISLKEWISRRPAMPLAVLNKKVHYLMADLAREHVDMAHICIDKRFDRLSIVRMCDGKK